MRTARIVTDLGWWMFVIAALVGGARPSDLKAPDFNLFAVGAGYTDIPLPQAPQWWLDPDWYAVVGLATSVAGIVITAVVSRTWARGFAVLAATAIGAALIIGAGTDASGRTFEPALTVLIAVIAVGVREVVIGRALSPTDRVEVTAGRT